MSIVWLEPFVFDPTGSNIFTFQSLNLMIYLNMISIICFVIYSLLYKSDLNMQKPPNTILIWKMFGECLVSFNFLLLFLCFSFENNKRKLETTNTIMYLISLLSPLGLFITYFFNACIAHNLYTTFYTYKNNFDVRMKIYKTIALMGGIVVFLLSLVCNNRSNHTSAQFTVSYYPFFFIAVFYFMGGVTILYMVFKVSYVLKNSSSFFSFLQESPEDSPKNVLIKLFVRRNVMFILIFMVEYIPNNIILLLQIFMSYKICINCSYYAIFIYMMSLSCSISFCIKMTEPYMKKYIKVIVNFLFRKHGEEIKEEVKDDYVNLYTKNGLMSDENEDSEMNEKPYLHGHGKSHSNKYSHSSDSPHTGNSSFKRQPKISTTELKTMADPLEKFTKQMVATDFFVRMIGITVSTEEDKSLDLDPLFERKTKDYLPWEDEIYAQKSKFKEYTNKNLPEWLKNQDTKIPNMRVKVRKYAPQVFHHIRKIDGFSLSDVIASLDPIKNLSIIKENFASGGRSANPILFTHDKKFLLKTIAKEEKDVLVKMLPEYHRRMRDCKSFLCRIYGVFRIIISEKENVHILLMRNMNDLPSETRLLVFDLKGSTVDRNTLEPKDRDMIRNGKKHEVVEKYAKKVLKDNDFKELEFKLKLSKKDAQFLQKNISADAEFLKGYQLTDYSLLLSLHKYSKDDMNKSFKNYRIMQSFDGDYIYNFSVIDFLTVYDLFKKGEKFGKGLGSYFKGSGDKNFSVQDSLTYSRRFIRMVIQNIQEENSEIE